MFDTTIAWLKAKWSERSTWDGTFLVGVGVVVLLFAPLIKWAAWAAIIYGAWRIWEDEAK